MTAALISSAGATPIPALGTLERLSPRLTAEYLETQRVLPLVRRDGSVLVGWWNTEPDVQTLDELSLAMDAELELVELPPDEARQATRRVYGSEETAQGLIARLDGGNGGPDDEIALDDLVHLANEAPVIRLVNLLLLEALEARASDVHLEAYVDGIRARYRVDGVLQDAPAPPRGMAAAIVSRLKIMAELDIAERRLPQDGRIRLKLQSRDVDVRVSTVPTLHGESVVLRLLDKAKGRIGLTELGMDPAVFVRFREVIGRPHGIVLATGPTGSGKTTTLYAAVDLIRTGREKILTVEDPVEYQLPGVPQVQVNERVGVTFAAALRSLLRQDPDVMLVGEIRDAETAEIATQAALTGHFVLSTLHTNDALGAITRLSDLGVAPFLVASTLEGVLAQRLVRVVCTHCRIERTITDGERLLLRGTEAPERVTYGAGCTECRGTGYRGRRGIYELLVIGDSVREAIARSASADELRRIALRAGMVTLREDGVRLIRSGTTTPEEVARVTPAA